MDSAKLSFATEECVRPEIKGLSLGLISILPVLARVDLQHCFQCTVSSLRFVKTIHTSTLPVPCMLMLS
jgi:hypothetical protein